MLTFVAAERSTAMSGTEKTPFARSIQEVESAAGANLVSARVPFLGEDCFSFEEV